MFKQSLLLIVLLIIFLSAGFFIGGIFLSKASVAPAVTIPTATSIPTRTPVSLSSEKLMALVNNWRVSQDFQIYIKNDAVCSFASKRVLEIEKDWSHTNFYEEVPQDFPPRVYVAENLAKGYFSEQETLNNWLISPAHRKNLDASYKYSCIKCDKNYCAQEFANYD